MNESPPRVVLVSTYFHPVIGGVETHARQLARGLVMAGVGAWVLTKRINHETPATDLVDGIRVCRTRPRGPRTSSAKWRFIPWAFAALVSARRSFDVILCLDYRGVGAAALAAGRLLRKPVVFDAETPGALSCANWDPLLQRLGLSSQHPLTRTAKWPLRLVYGSADAYACISRELEREALDRGIPRDRVWYLPHTVNTAAFRPSSLDEREAARRTLSLPPDLRIVAFVGRLGREKGILDLLDAWKTLDRSDAVLLVVGPDMPGNALDAGPEVRAAAAALGPQRVILHGPAVDVRPMLAVADVFVQPSHYEAFGLSAVEAMATGLPVVACRVGGLAEYLRDGENGLLCAPRDPGGLAHQIARILDDPALAQRLGARARQTAVEEFEEKRVTIRWAELICSLRPSGARRPRSAAVSLLAAVSEVASALL